MICSITSWPRNSASGLNGWFTGDTDSARVFALITAYARRDGDLGRAIVDAVDWIAANLPVYALNLILTTPADLWVLRYPDTHPLYVLARPAGGTHGHRHLEHASASGTVRVRSGDLAEAPAVVVASEPMDEDPNWRLLAAGELLHVAADQRLTTRTALDRPPAHLLTLADLQPRRPPPNRPAPTQRDRATDPSWPPVYCCRRGVCRSADPRSASTPVPVLSDPGWPVTSTVRRRRILRHLPHEPVGWFSTSRGAGARTPPAGHYPPRTRHELVAHVPGQVWSWDHQVARRQDLTRGPPGSETCVLNFREVE